VNGIPDIVFLSTNHWTGLPTSKQHLTWVLSEKGKVLYVDPPIDVFSVVGRPRRWSKLLGVREGRRNVWVESPVVLAASAEPRKRLAFHRRRAGRLGRLCARLGFRAPVLWTFSPEHGAYAGAVGESLTVYHVTDDLAAMSAYPEQTREMERRHVAAADLVLAVSSALTKRLEATREVHRLPNAADARHYRRIVAGDASAPLETFAEALERPRVVPREFVDTDGPILLYGGAAYHWFDADLFLDLARLRPRWTLAVVGPVGKELARRALPANVLLVGRKPYDVFPWYVAAADVAIMPWRDGGFSRHADPIVLYEYLLCGKPVVASPFPAALERGRLVRVARTGGEFAAAVEAALDERSDPGAARERIEFGFGNTWEDRAATALELIATRPTPRGERGQAVPPERSATGGEGSEDPPRREGAR
jgi:glycosyltransferase involved in cell wall biosynthesis